MNALKMVMKPNVWVEYDPRGFYRLHNAPGSFIYLSQEVGDDYFDLVQVESVEVSE